MDRDLGALARRRGGGRRRRPLYALPTYTALLELRDLLARARPREAVVGMTSAAVAWHDVECASYDADLSALAGARRRRARPVLDLGAGTGRVALDLAARGHDVTALDSDAGLLAALAHRARERGLRVHASTADARALRARPHASRS